jgi:hypothetical protein
MSRSAIEEGAFIPKITQLDDAIRGVFDGGSPPLLAYCLSEARPLAKTILKTKKDDPLLMTGRNGLASTFAFTSDAKSKWASQWVGWPQFGTFWSQIVRSIGRQAPRNNYQVDVKQESGKARIVVTARDPNGNPLNAPETPVRIGAPDGTSKDLVLNQTGPGIYESEFETPSVGSYIVSVVESDGKGGARVQTAGASVSYPAEYRIFRPNTSLLNETATSTKGKIVTKPTEIFRPVELQGKSFTEVWAFFIFLAMMVLPFDIATRRIVVPLTELFRSRKKAAKPDSGPSLQGLHRAKQRVQTHKKLQTGPSILPDSILTPKETVAKPEPEPTKPDLPAAPMSSSTAGALLAKKRNRKDD